MQLARTEVLDDCSLLLYPGFPLFTVGGFHLHPKNINTSNNKLEDLNRTVSRRQHLLVTYIRART